MSENDKRPSLDLYPLMGPPSTPPVWADVERLALHYPAARHAVAMVERGDYTREEALIALVFALADAFSRLFKAEVDRRMTEPMTPFVIPSDR